MIHPKIIKNIRERYTHSQAVQKVSHNIGWLFIDKILRMGVGLIVGVWVARYLGPEQYGTINFAGAFVAIFSALSTLGLDGIVVRDIVREPERNYEILSSAFILKLLGGALAFLISLSAIIFMRPSDNQTHWLVAIIGMGMIFQAFDAIDLWFQSQVKSKYTVIARNSAFVVFALIKVFLILTKAPLIAFAWAIIAEVILGQIGLVWFFSKTEFSFKINKKEMLRLFIAAFPLFLQSILVSVNQKLDQVVIGTYLTTRDLGIYSVSIRITEIFYFLPMALSISVFPYVTNIRDEKEREMKLVKISGYILKLFLFIFLFLQLFSDPLVRLLFGSKYEGAGNILLIYSIILLPVYYGIIWSQWILLEQKQKLLLISFISTLVSNIILMTILTPRYGVYGVAMSAATSSLIGQSVGILQYRTRFALKLLKGIVTPYN
jgi:polysaccharide transporter, PST family